MTYIPATNVIPAANLDYFWNTLVSPRLGNATHQPDAYVWGGSFSASDVNQGTDCTGAASAELSALMRGAGCIYDRQFYTGTFAGIEPGAVGPFGGIDDTSLWVCVASPDDVPEGAAMIIAVIQDPNAEDAHMIVRVQGVDIEMGGQSNNYHDSLTDSTCAHVTDTTEFNQWFYVNATIEEGAFSPAMPTEPSDTLWADVSEFQPVATDAYTSATYTAGNGVTAKYQYLSIRSDDGTYQDHNFTANYQWCVQAANAGLLLGFFVYCYYRPGWQNDFDTMKSMVESLGGPHPLMVAMIDVESGGNPDVDESADLDDLYNALVQWLGGNDKRVIAYANVGDESVMWQTQPAGLEWILAGYGSNPTPPAGTFKLAHQYTDGTVAAGSLPMGAPPFGNCDMNSADGYTPTALATALGITPTPEEDVSYLTAQQAQDQYNWTLFIMQQQCGLFEPAVPMLLLPGCSPTQLPPGGWGQLGFDSKGENLTPVDAMSVTLQAENSIGAYVAAIKTKLGA